MYRLAEGDATWGTVESNVCSSDGGPVTRKKHPHEYHDTQYKMSSASTVFWGRTHTPMLATTHAQTAQTKAEAP